MGATEDEVTALRGVYAEYGGLYAAHTRNRDEEAVEAVAEAEAIRTAARAGVRLQVSHITPRGGRADLERSIELVDTARAGGADACPAALTSQHALGVSWRRIRCARRELVTSRR